jgi:glycogen operon protein
VAGSELPDISWFRADGREMVQSDWQSPPRATVGLLLTGDALDWRDVMGEPVVDDSFLILLNGAREDLFFTIPTIEWGSRWVLCIDTANDVIVEDPEVTSVDAGAQVAMLAHSMLVFKRTQPGRGSWRPNRPARGGF